MSLNRFGVLPAYSKRSITKEVCGQPLTLYPISVNLLFALRGIAPPLAAAFASFMEGGGRRDQKVVERTWGTKDQNEFGSHVETEPVSAAVSQQRVDQREKAMRSLVDALLGDDCKGLLGQIILDCVRPRTERELPSQAEGLEFVQTLDIESLKEYAVAVIEANRGVFGPFLEKMGAIKKALSERIENALGQPGSPKSPDEGSGAASNSAAAPPPATPATAAAST